MSSIDVRDQSRGSGRFVHRARLDGVRSQIAFALLLDTLARPGEIRSLARVELPLGVPAPLVVPLALADVEVGVAVVTGDPDSPWPSLVQDVTGAPVVALDLANQVVLLDGFRPDHLLTLFRGTNEDPEQGARVAIACRHLRRVDLSDESSESAVVVELSGPGIDGHRRLGIDGLDPSVLRAIAQVNRNFPAGIDCWFASTLGDIAAIPRSSRIELIQVPTPDEESD